MIRVFSLTVLFCVFLLGQGSVTTVPLVIATIVLFTLSVKNPWWVYALSTFAGLYLDVSQVRLLGITSLFFVVFLYVITLYEKKFEIHTIQFTILFSFVGSILFLTILDQDYGITKALITTGASAILFVLFGFRQNSLEKYGKNVQ